MPLSSLPNELLLLIAENLEPKLGNECARNLAHLLQTNRHFSILLTPLLHEAALCDKGYLSALAWAARRGHAPLVRLALDKGFDANAATSGIGSDCFYTPLLWAVEGGNEEILRILLERGAKVNLGVPRFTPLHRATEKNSDAMVELLLDYGANVELREDVGLTPLLMARCEKIVRLLLDRGAEVNARTKRGGATALHLACIRGEESIVRLLLEKGASVTQVDDNGMTPRQQATSSGMAVIKALLVEKEDIIVCVLGSHD